MASDPAHSYPGGIAGGALEHALPEHARRRAEPRHRRPGRAGGTGAAAGGRDRRAPATGDLAGRRQRRAAQRRYRNRSAAWSRKGVARLQEAGIDVILMDNQHSPRVDAAPEHGVLNVDPGAGCRGHRRRPVFPRRL